MTASKITYFLLQQPSLDCKSFTEELHFQYTKDRNSTNLLTSGKNAEEQIMLSVQLIKKKN